MKNATFILCALLFSGLVTANENSLANHGSNSGKAGHNNYSVKIRSGEGETSGPINVNIGPNVNTQPVVEVPLINEIEFEDELVSGDVVEDVSTTCNWYNFYC